MSRRPAYDARGLGQRLYRGGFRPLPEVTDDGILVGTRLWRVRTGTIEYLTLHHDGLAHAGRVEATFDYQRPADHGPVLEHRSGHPDNVLGWLLTVTDPPAAQQRPYSSPARRRRIQLND